MNISIKSHNQLTTQFPPTDLFNKSHFEKVKLPCLEAKTLPSWCYTSEEWYRREVDRIVLPSWHFVGHLSEFENSGDYKTIDFQGYKILVIKGQDNKIRAFHNSCRHRGSKLLEDEGNCKTIRCRYHSWNYAIDGTLKSAPYMDNIHKEDNNLLDIKCQVSQGLIFINLNTESTSLEEFLGDFSENVRSYNLEDMICVKSKEYSLNSNWKLYIEVDMETYHTPHIHTQSIGKQKVEDITGSGDWVSVYHKSEHTVALAPEDRLNGFPHITSLEGKAAEGIFFTVIFPGFFIVTAQDSMWWIHKIPEGPEKTRVKIGYCFPRETTNREDFEEKAELYYKRWDQVINEDNWITEFQQEAIRSSIPGSYSHLESVVHKLDNWIIDRVID